MPETLRYSHTIQLTSREATLEFGQRLGALLPPGQIVAMSGDLGAGKTTLTLGIAVGLGITAHVTSPTFTLINQFNPGARRLLLVHIDTYRLGESQASAQAEAANLGLDEIFVDAALPDSHSDGAIVVIEWAERVAAMLPPTTLYITLVPVSNDPGARTATLATDNAELAVLLGIEFPG